MGIVLVKASCQQSTETTETKSKHSKECPVPSCAWVSTGRKVFVAHLSDHLLVFIADSEGHICQTDQNHGHEAFHEMVGSFYEHESLTMQRGIAKQTLE